MDPVYHLTWHTLAINIFVYPAYWHAGAKGANPVGVHGERTQPLRKGREMLEVNKIDRQVGRSNNPPRSSISLTTDIRPR